MAHVSIDLVVSSMLNSMKRHNAKRNTAGVHALMESAVMLVIVYGAQRETVMSLVVFARTHPSCFTYMRLLAPFVDNEIKKEIADWEKMHRMIMRFD
jgi:hypothetical protein